MFYTLVLQFYFKNGQKKKRRWYLFEKKTEEKQNIPTIMISLDGKGAVSAWSWNYKGNLLNKDIKKSKKKAF